MDDSLVDEAVEHIERTYGLAEGELHEYLMARKSVRALCAAVDATILRSDLDPRSYIADARLTLEEVPGLDISTDPAELARRVACTRPSAERERIEAEYGSDE